MNSHILQNFDKHEWIVKIQISQVLNEAINGGTGGDIKNDEAITYEHNTDTERSLRFDVENFSFEDETIRC